MATIEEIDAQIRQLEDQKNQVLQKAKDGALNKANAAIAELAKMGFTYRLVEGTSTSRPASSGTRRTGQREAVLAAVKAVPTGISAAKVLENMGANSDSEKTSVRNALSALKKAGTIKLNNGLYSA